MVENPHRFNSTLDVSTSNGNQTSGSIRPDGFSQDGPIIVGTSPEPAKGADNGGANPVHNGPHIYLTSEKSITTPLISQEKFHWTQVSKRAIMSTSFI